MKKNKFLIFFIIFLITLYLYNNVHYFFKKTKNLPDTSYNMLVHYIDVGEGDSILIQVNNKNLLIDSGPSSSENNLIKYLKSLNLRNIDYVIATHPHEDHIGNMSKILSYFHVESFYAPEIESSTRTFENMIDTLKDNNLKINIIKRNLNSIDLGNNTSITVFSPYNEYYDNLNNYSPIIKIEYGSTSFLFTGDAETDIEKKLLNNGDDIRSDVLKIGHHGSSTSTSLNFLKKVNPIISVISVGENNEFNHPNKNVIDNLKKNNVLIFQTNINGSIILCSNGTNITKIK